MPEGGEFEPKENARDGMEAYLGVSLRPVIANRVI